MPERSAYKSNEHLLAWNQKEAPVLREKHSGLRPTGKDPAPSNVKRSRDLGRALVLAENGTLPPLNSLSLPDIAELKRIFCLYSLSFCPVGQRAEDGQTHGLI